MPPYFDPYDELRKLLLDNPFDGALTSSQSTSVDNTSWQTDSFQTQRNQTIETAHGNNFYTFLNNSGFIIEIVDHYNAAPGQNSGNNIMALEPQPQQTPKRIEIKVLATPANTSFASPPTPPTFSFQITAASASTTIPSSVIIKKRKSLETDNERLKRHRKEKKEGIDASKLQIHHLEKEINEVKSSLHDKYIRLNEQEQWRILKLSCSLHP